MKIWVRRELSLILRFGNHLCAWSLKTLREHEITQVYISKIRAKKELQCLEDSHGMNSQQK